MYKLNFLPDKEEYAVFNKIHTELSEKSSPNEIAQNSRSLLEEAIRFIYRKECVNYPANATLLEVIDGNVISRFVENKVLLESLHYVRKLGMNAVHGVHIKKNQAKIAKDNIVFFLQFLVSKYEEAETIDDIVLPPYMSERQTRKIYIDEYLQEAGWEIVEPNNTTEIAGGLRVISGTVLPGKACCEIPVRGMNNVSGIGFCDYVLYDKNGKPLAIVEAKKTSEAAGVGQKQVKDYGECMKAEYGYVPVLYYTNGYDIYVIDGLYPARLVRAFHSMAELQYMIQKRKRNKITDFRINDAISGRPYQKMAITSVCERFNDMYRRCLLVMATGTGKTRVSISLVDVLARNKWIKNVLFLADRTSLVEQAFRNFKKILPDMSYQVLSDRRLADEPNARVVFSTHQTMINYIDAEKKEYTCGRFDLIIVDEAHRSIFNKYGSIFTYFDALLVGLTATPREQVDADTYQMFGCENGEPNFAYSLEEAVKEKYLVPYKLESRTTKLLSRGIKYKDLSQGDKEKVDSVLEDEDRDEDYHIPKEKLFKLIYNIDTCSKVLNDLMENGMRIDFGQKVGKTIIFAYNHKHAQLIVDVFKRNYPKYGENYCQLIDNQVKGADDLIIKFGEDEEFRIAVSVDMLDTGIDVPSVLNLVFFKPIRSKIKFVQMIGRGTRLCEGLIDGKDKRHFLIFDYFDNFAFFDMNSDGTENHNGKSLSQKLYDVKLDILVELQSYERQTDEIYKEYYDKLKAELYGKTKEVKKHSSRISVRQEMSYIDKYLDYERWDVIAPLSKKEMQLHLSKLIDNDINEDKGALRFDMQMLQIELSVLASGGISEAARQVERVRHIAKYLLDYAVGQPAVLEKLETLKQVVSIDFWMNPGIDKLESYREDIRNLLIYLPPKVDPVDVNTPDEVIQQEYSGDLLIDIRTYKEKVIDYLAANEDNATIRKIQNLEQIDLADLKELERILWHDLGTVDEYHKETEIDNLAAFIRSIVGVEQEAINKKFGEFLSDNVMNSSQQEFVKAIIDYVRENGDIQVEDLIEKSPFANYDILELFGTNIRFITQIVNTMHNSIVVA